jgi:class 3 adenylate cyclase
MTATTNADSNLMFSSEQVLDHVQAIAVVYHENPRYAGQYLSEFLKQSGYATSPEPRIEAARKIIRSMEEQAKDVPILSRGDDKGADSGMSEEMKEALEKASREIIFRKEIEEYYLPKQLINAIIENGGIPKNSMEATIGIGFTDIADYTYLTKFLSPKENQIVLNGLYSAFNWVLNRHGGYLNKIEGDSIMFHYGGLIDPRVKGLSPEETTKYIAKELFYTCIEMQRVCVLFNQANDRFLYDNADESTKEAVQSAFTIISSLRNNLELSSSINALFQIRIRIGANIGEVTIGNFGPEGAKQWDVIGLPVIDAKRMESTAPIGGLRISEHFYKVLNETGIVQEYFNRFKREAQALFGYYKDITIDNLFKFSTVCLKDKRNVEFRTYSIQVNPGLPEDIMRQAELLLEKGEHGADRILDLLQYYRGNRYVISALEEMFKKRDIRIRKDQILRTIYPKKYHAFLEKLGNDTEKARRYIDEHYSLYLLFEKLGKYQDVVKSDLFHESSKLNFTAYDDYMKRESARIHYLFKAQQRSTAHKTYFFNVIYPLCFQSIRASILEYQNKVGVLEAF